MIMINQSYVFCIDFLPFNIRYFLKRKKCKKDSYLLRITFSFYYFERYWVRFGNANDFLFNTWRCWSFIDFQQMASFFYKHISASASSCRLSLRFTNILHKNTYFTLNIHQRNFLYFFTKTLLFEVQFLRVKRYFNF